MVRQRRAGSVLALVMLAILHAPAQAGAPVVPSPECQQLSVQPPLYRLEFLLNPVHASGFYPLCEVKIEPFSWGGVPARPVLDCSGPEPFIASVDSSGTAHFKVDPCVVPWFFQHFRLEVAAVPATFRATLSGTGGNGWVHTDYIVFPCATIVPVVRRSWGSVKTLYR